MRSATGLLAAVAVGLAVLGGVLSAVGVSASVFGSPTPIPAGTLSGTVTSAATGSPITGFAIGITVYDAAGSPVTSTFAAPSTGAYSVSDLPAGQYYVRTTPDTVPPGYLHQVFNGLNCSPACPAVTAGTAVSVGEGTTDHIDFSLVLGGWVEGTVVDAGSGEPLTDMAVQVYGATGWVTTAYTDASGVFATDALAAATYYAVTAATTGHVNQLFNGITCMSCTPQSGTPIQVVAGNTTWGVDFSLAQGGALSGTVRDASTSGALAGVTVAAYTAAGALAKTGTPTDASGHYTISGLVAGQYFVRTVGAPGHYDQIYAGIDCADTCPAITTGTSVLVSQGGTTGGIDFSLAAPTAIAGTVTDGTQPLAGVTVSARALVGGAVTSAVTNGSGVYTIRPLTAGSYYVSTTNTLGYIDELYADVACPHASCSLSPGTKVNVTSGATTGGIDFALAAGGTISGRVSSGGTPLSNVRVYVYTSAGTSRGYVLTGPAGTYATSGLPAGSYRIRTQNSEGYLDQLYDGLPCPDAVCDVRTGTAIDVTVGAVQGNRDFALAPGGTITGTVRHGTTPLAGVAVYLYNATGGLAALLSTSAAGVYTRAGLTPGNFFVRTWNSGVYLDQLHSGIPCPAHACPAATTGTPVPVAGGGTATVDFLLGLEARPTFTDDPLIPRSTRVKAAHLNELRARIGDLRQRFGLAPVSWTDATLLAGVTPVKAAHLTELRTALQQVYEAAGRAAPTYTTPIVTGGVTVISAAHVSELRDAILAIW